MLGVRVRNIIVCLINRVLRPGSLIRSVRGIYGSDANQINRLQWPVSGVYSVELVRDADKPRFLSLNESSFGMDSELLPRGSSIVISSPKAEISSSADTPRRRTPSPLVDVVLRHITFCPWVIGRSNTKNLFYTVLSQSARHLPAKPRTHRRRHPGSV